MSTKADWEAAYRTILKEGRAKLGEPPSTEELLAYSGEGDLSSEQRTRIEEFLSYYPEWVRALEAPLPGEDEPVVREALSQEQVDEDWEKIQAVLAGHEGPVPAGTPSTAWRPAAIAACIVAALLGGLYWHTLRSVTALEQQAREPRANPAHRLLLPDGHRGAATPEEILLPIDADSYLLAPALITQRRFPDYRLDILRIRADREELLWSTTGLRRRRDDTFELWVPRSFLEPGIYRLDLYGAGEEEVLETYTLRARPGQ